METTSTRILVKGIVRNRARDEFADGECQEIVNMRYRDNAWRIIKPPVKLHNELAAHYDNIWLHDQDGVNNMIGWHQSGDSGLPELLLISPALGTHTLIKSFDADVTWGKVYFIKRVMVVLTNKGITKLLWKDGDYKDITVFGPPVVDFVTEAIANVTTQGASTPDGVLAMISKMDLDENNKYGKLAGTIMFRCAYKLFDGSYILHTLPIRHRIAELEMTISRKGANYQVRYQIANIIAKFRKVHYQMYGDLTDIINSVVIFASQAEKLYLIDDTIITQDLLDDVPDSGSKLFSSFAPVNPDLKTIVDSQGWYKVGEMPLSDLLWDDRTLGIETNGYYLDFSARETMPIDNFTHHKLSSEVAATYNDRLILGGVTTIMGDANLNTYIFGLFDISPLANLAGFARTITPNYQAYALTEISSSNGTAYNVSLISGTLCTSGGKNFVVFERGVIGYPDSRAKNIRILANLMGNYWQMASFALTPSKHDNFAYYIDPVFDSTTPNSVHANYGLVTVEVNFLTGTLIQTLEPYTNSPSISDQNRVQVSELRNPFVFPAKNSYQVGTGTIMGFGTNTEAISQGQFGQYPLIVFTSKGVWAMEQGQGDVLFAAISPVNGDVVTDGSEIINAGTGVMYMTDRGAYIIYGKEVHEITQPVEGEINTDFLQNDHLGYFLQSAILGGLISEYTKRGAVSTQRALEYMESARIGFDKTNNELIFCNTETDLRGDRLYDYSYVYNLETQSWHKIYDVYNRFINAYPHLYGVKYTQGTNNGIYNLSVDSSTHGNKVLIITQPQSLQMNEIYKKIARCVLRCRLSIPVGTYAGIYIFASDDLRTWQFITGAQRTGEIQNMLMTRSHTMAKYYIFVISGYVGVNSTISGIDVSVVPRLHRKLRT